MQTGLSITDTQQQEGITMSNIKCANLPEFIEVCAGLVRQSILFEADSDSLTITLTGGF